MKRHIILEMVVLMSVLALCGACVHECTNDDLVGIRSAANKFKIAKSDEDFYAVMSELQEEYHKMKVADKKISKRQILSLFGAPHLDGVRNVGYIFHENGNPEGLVVIIWFDNSDHVDRIEFASCVSTCENPVLR